MRELIIIGLLVLSVTAHAQLDSVKTTLSLRSVIQLAIEQSSSVKYAQNQNVNYYWRWRNYQTYFRPQLTFSGDLPDYQHSTTPVVQPDGSIQFKQISQAKASANLALSQSIPFTGTYIYAASSLYRMQDFRNKTTDFSGSPFYIGFTQPLFAYNWMKWYRKTEPLVYDEAQKEFNQSIERACLEATNRFFKYLRIQTNYNLAESNLRNSEDNLKIAEVRRTVGDISENDFSRIQLSVFNAQKALSKARMDLKNADFELKSFIGLEQNINIDLSIPLEMFLFEIDVKKAIEEAFANRRETPYFQRRLIEADRDLVEAKKSNGLSITLRSSYGLSNSSPEFGGVYENPEKQRMLRLSLSVPIMDWGKSDSRVKLAESRRDLVIYDVERDRIDFERQVVVEVEQFNLLKDQIVTAKEADKVAENGYQIALKKFQNGEISITDLNISLSERESAKRDYISSIENYWESYFTIRILTLYDFELRSKIYWANPLLTEN